jgi:hypothetical protein
MQNFYFYTFYFFLIFLGWAQLSPHGLGSTQPARPGHWPKPVARLGKRRRSTRELLTHAGNSASVIKKER